MRVGATPLTRDSAAFAAPKMPQSSHTLDFNRFVQLNRSVRLVRRDLVVDSCVRPSVVCCIQLVRLRVSRI